MQNKLLRFSRAFTSSSLHVPDKQGEDDVLHSVDWMRDHGEGEVLAAWVRFASFFSSTSWPRTPDCERFGSWPMRADWTGLTGCGGTYDWRRNTKLPWDESDFNDPASDVFYYLTPKLVFALYAPRRSSLMRSIHDPSMASCNTQGR
jgi:hypothetical protein